MIRLLLRVLTDLKLLLLLLLLLSLSPLYRLFTRMSPDKPCPYGIHCCSYSFVLLSVRCAVRISLVPTLVLMVFYYYYYYYSGWFHVMSGVNENSESKSTSQITSSEFT